MDIANKIRTSLSMRDIADKYSLVVNQAGFATCPFHSDKTASLKIYPSNKGWHCFGCGEGGSVIDFVMKLFDMRFLDTCKKIDDDFGLKIIEQQRNKTLDKLAIMAAKKQKAKEAHQREEVARRYEHYYNQYRYVNNKAKESDDFQSINELPYDVIEAIKDLCIAEYYLDYEEENLRGNGK